MKPLRVIPSLLVLAGWGLRLTCLPCQNLWYDEAFTLAVTKADWSTFWQALLSDAVHPPGYYLLLRGWLWVSGDSEFGLRFLSVVTGALAISLMWRLAGALGGRRLAVVAAVLLVLNPFAIWYAQEARMYSLVLCLATGIGWIFWRLLQSPGWRRWLPFTLATAAAFLIHYFAFLLSLAQFAYLVLRLRKHHRAFRWWVLAQAAAVLPFLPWAWLVATREGRNFGIGWIPQTTLVDIPLTISNLSLALSQPDSPWTWIGLVLILAACLWSLWCNRVKPQESTGRLSFRAKRGISPFTQSTTPSITEVPRPEKSDEPRRRLSFRAKRGISPFVQSTTSSTEKMPSSEQAVRLRTNKSGASSEISDGYLYLSMWLIVPLVFVWLLSQRLPIYIDRFFIISLPALLLLVSTVGLCPGRLARGIMAVVLLATTTATARLWLDPNLVKERWQAATDYVSQNELGGDVLVMRDFQTGIPFRAYYGGTLELQTATTNRQSVPMESLAAGHERLWIVYRQPSQATHRLAGSKAINWTEETDPVLASWLSAHKEEILTETSFPGVYLLLFDLKD